MPGVEFAKWLGFAAMIYNHWGVFVEPLPYFEMVGSFAFPLFVWAIAAATRNANARQDATTIKRMLVWGFLAQVVVVLVRDPLPLNVLFTLASGVAFARAIQSREQRWVYLAIAVVIGAVSEFTIVGTAVTGLMIASARGLLSPWSAIAASVPLYAFNAGWPTATLAVVALTYWGHALPELPRRRRVFYPLYVVQYPLLRLFG